MKKLLIICTLFCLSPVYSMNRARLLAHRVAKSHVLARAMTTQTTKPTVETDRAFGHTYYQVMSGQELTASARVNWSEGQIFSFSVFARSQGYGTLLLNRILEDFKKQNKSNLSIVTDPSQKNFFLDRGFKRGELKFGGRSLYLSKKKHKETE